MRRFRSLKKSPLSLIMVSTAFAAAPLALGACTSPGGIEATGATGQALWQQGSDGQPADNTDIHAGATGGEDANIVVRLRSATDENAICSGTLLTPSRLLTSRNCVGRLGTKWIAQFDFPTSDGTWTYALTMTSNAATPIWPLSEGLQILAVDLVRSPDVLEVLRVPRQKLLPPTAQGTTTDRGSLFTNLGIAGWSPYFPGGSVEPVYANARQRVEPGELYLRKWQTGSLPFWVREIGQTAYGTATGDEGSPIYVRPSGAATDRQIVGIATRVGVTVADTPSTFTNLARCDSPGKCEGWIDVTTAAMQKWVTDQVADRSHPANGAWTRMHPVLRGSPSPRWIGDVDYFGKCDEHADADCDHIYDSNRNPANPNGTDTPRDNCLGFFNPDQEDVDDDGVGDTCQPPVVAAKQTTQSFQYAGNPRVVAQDWRLGNIPIGQMMEPVSADNTFDAKAVSHWTNVDLGHTRASVCDCVGDSFCNRTLVRRSGAACDRPSTAYPDSLTWKPMTLAQRPSGGAAQIISNVGGEAGILRSRFGTPKLPVQEKWGWLYWNDLSNLPAPRAASPRGNPFGAVPQTVFDGVAWTWVRNYGCDAGVRPRPLSPSCLPLPSSTEVSAPEQADLRQAVTPTVLHESAATATMFPWSMQPRAFPLLCALWGDCSAMLYRDASGQWNVGNGDFEVTASRVLPLGLLHALEPAATNDLQQALLVSSDARADGSRIFAAIDARTHDVRALYASGSQGFASLHAAVRAPSTAQATPLAAALNARHTEVAFFGEIGTSPAAATVRFVSVQGDASRTGIIQGVSRGLGVLSATYRAEDDAYYVLERAADGDNPLVRLVRIDRRLRGQVVGSWARSSSFTQYSLTAGSGGMLALTVELDAGHVVALLDVSGATASPRAIVYGAYALAAPARVTTDGLALTFATDGAPLSEVLPIDRGTPRCPADGHETQGHPQDLPKAF